MPRNKALESPGETRRFVRYWFALVGGLAFALLIGHTFMSKTWNVDTVTLGLLGVLLLVPVADRITKLKIGALEAELSPAEVRRAIGDAKEEVSGLPRLERVTEVAEPLPASGWFKQWASSFDDAAKAMAADRIDLERSLTQVARLAGMKPRRAGIRALAEQLLSEGIIDPRALSAIRDVAPVLDASAHGEYVDWEIAFQLHEVLQDLMSYLQTVEATILGQDSD